MTRPILLCLLSVCCLYCSAQKITADTTFKDNKKTTREPVKQKDLIDIFYSILKKDPSKRIDTTKIRPGKIYFSGAPSPAYQTQTGIAIDLTGNFAFYRGDTSTTKISSVLMDFDYTQKKQILLPLESNVWSKDNKYNFIGDWRYLKYPEQIYGIGGYTTENDGYPVDYDYFRFYQFVLKKISNNFYGGLGVQYDHHWNIQEVGVRADSITDFKKYGFSPTSTSAGVAVNFLYNNVKNMINPEGGFYANMILRQNFTFLGSDQNWSSLLIDIRKYFPVGNKGNILAFWTYDWLTLSGNPPYLDLPSNGWDTYSNTDRGYVQSRFAGKKMVDLESEFRFGVSRNGLIGGVVFGNVSSYTEFNNTFQVLQPAAGAGIRIKFNKFARTNIAIDYGMGLHGSHGVFINLGEVF